MCKTSVVAGGGPARTMSARKEIGVHACVRVIEVKCSTRVDEGTICGLLLAK